VRKNKIGPGQGIDLTRGKIKTDGYGKKDRQARTQKTMLRSREGTKGKTRDTNKIQELFFPLQSKQDFNQNTEVTGVGPSFDY
jgi:hypothetical protein